MKDLHVLDSYRLTDFERNFYGETGGSGNGCFKVYVGGRSFFIVASDGGGWEHISVSPCNKKRKSCPTWEEMCAIKEMFFEPEDCVVEYHPPRSDYVNMHPYCLHLWRPCGGVEIPRPPTFMVGAK